MQGVQHGDSVRQRLRLGDFEYPVEAAETIGIREVLRVKVEFEFALVMRRLQDNIETQKRAKPEFEFRIGKQSQGRFSPFGLSTKGVDEDAGINEDADRVASGAFTCRVFRRSVDESAHSKASQSPTLMPCRSVRAAGNQVSRPSEACGALGWQGLRYRSAVFDGLACSQVVARVRYPNVTWNTRVLPAGGARTTDRTVMSTPALNARRLRRTLLRFDRRTGGCYGQRSGRSADRASPCRWLLRRGGVREVDP